MLRFFLVMAGWSLVVVSSVGLPLVGQWIDKEGPEWMLGDDGHIGAGVFMAMLALWLTTWAIAVVWAFAVTEWFDD